MVTKSAKPLKIENNFWEISTFIFAIRKFKDKLD